MLLPSTIQNNTKHKTTGYLVTYAGVRFPGAENIPAGFAALDALPGQVVAQMGFTLFLMEAANSPTPGTYNNFKPEFQGERNLTYDECRSCIYYFHVANTNPPP